MNTIKPATQLPWKSDGAWIHANPPTGSYGHPSGATKVAEIFYGGEREIRAANSSYIVHACNAYPQLVEALRQSLADMELAAPKLKNFPEFYQSISEARALLRSLGEE